MHRCTLVFALFTCSVIAPSAHSQSRVADSVAQVGNNYALRPGDIIRLRIWREPDLSGDFPVDATGAVNLPLVGTYPVTRETRESLHDKLVSAYRKSVENLSMDVIFLRKLAIVGAVRTPGLYAVDPTTTTVGDAIAIAGGPTPDARRSLIEVRRSGRTFLPNVDAAALVSQLPIERGDQIFIPGDDSFIARNPWVIGTVIQSVVSIGVAILISRR